MNVGVNPCGDCAAWPVLVWLAAGCEPSEVHFTKKGGNDAFADPRFSQNSYEKTAKSCDLAVFFGGDEEDRTLDLGMLIKPQIIIP